MGVGSDGGGMALGSEPGICKDMGVVWGGFCMRLPIADDMLAHSSAIEFHLASRVLILSERRCFASGSDVCMIAMSVWMMLSSSCLKMSLFIRSSC